MKTHRLLNKRLYNIKMSSSSKTLINKLNDLLKTNKQEIIDWLEMLKIYNMTDGKIPHLFDNTTIKIETVNETGTYNVILLWLKDNKHHFKDDAFVGIPDSNHTKISEMLEAGAKEVSPNKTFKDKKDVARWMIDPTIHPITGKPLNPFSSEYSELYMKAFNILKKKNPTFYDLVDLSDLIPNKHILFGNIDVLFYINSQIVYNTSTTLMTGLGMFSMKNTKQKDTILETEIEMLKNLVNKKKIKELGNNSIFEFIDNAIENHIDTIIANLILNNDFDYKTTSIEDIVYYEEPRVAIDFILFLENNTMSNGMIVIDFIKNSNFSWRNEYLELYEKYKNLYVEIVELLNPNSGIIENYENKKIEHIIDPVDKYFTKYENVFKTITSSKFLRFIDMTTLKPVNIEELLKPKPNKPIYLNDKDFAKFEEDYKIANLNNPIKLGNGIEYKFGNPKPIHISDKLLLEFKEEYGKVKSTIQKYNKFKNMSYDDLVKYGTDISPKSPESPISPENNIFKMSRKQIKSKILYDESSSLVSKCNNTMDVFTNDEFDDENYPLAKLQLMIRLDFNNKIECIYAPALYNYWIDCVNNDKPFINPNTRQPYTEEHITELMKIMKIIDSNIRIPEFIKPVNDTKLLIKTVTVPIEIKDYDVLEGWGAIKIVNFIEINIVREFNNKNYTIYNLCTIPADIEAGGKFATNSTNLTSAVMLSKIIILFESGKLLNKYVPPYFDIINIDRNEYKQFIKLDIEFNKYNFIDDWLENPDSKEPITKEEHVEMFIKYATKINDII